MAEISEERLLASVRNYINTMRGANDLETVTRNINASARRIENVTYTNRFARGVEFKVNAVGQITALGVTKNQRDLLTALRTLRDNRAADTAEKTDEEVEIDNTIGSLISSLEETITRAEAREARAVAEIEELGENLVEMAERAYNRAEGLENDAEEYEYSLDSRNITFRMNENGEISVDGTITNKEIAIRRIEEAIRRENTSEEVRRMGENLINTISADIARERAEQERAEDERVAAEIAREGEPQYENYRELHDRVRQIGEVDRSEERSSSATNRVRATSADIRTNESMVQVELSNAVKFRYDLEGNLKTYGGTVLAKKRMLLRLENLRKFEELSEEDRATVDKLMDSLNKALNRQQDREQPQQESQEEPEYEEIEVIRKDVIRERLDEYRRIASTPRVLSNVSQEDANRYLEINSQRERRRQILTSIASHQAVIEELENDISGDAQERANRAEEINRYRADIANWENELNGLPEDLEWNMEQIRQRIEEMYRNNAPREDINRLRDLLNSYEYQLLLINQQRTRREELAAQLRRAGSDGENTDEYEAAMAEYDSLPDDLDLNEEQIRTRLDAVNTENLRNPEETIQRLEVLLRSFEYQRMMEAAARITEEDRARAEDIIPELEDLLGTTPEENEYVTAEEVRRRLAEYIEERDALQARASEANAPTRAEQIEEEINRLRVSIERHRADIEITQENMSGDAQEQAGDYQAIAAMERDIAEWEARILALTAERDALPRDRLTEINERINDLRVSIERHRADIEITQENMSGDAQEQAGDYQAIAAMERDIAEWEAEIERLTAERDALPRDRLTEINERINDLRTSIERHRADIEITQENMSGDAQEQAGDYQAIAAMERDIAEWEAEIERLTAERDELEAARSGQQGLTPEEQSRLEQLNNIINELENILRQRETIRVPVTRGDDDRGKGDDDKGKGDDDKGKDDDDKGKGDDDKGKGDDDKGKDDDDKGKGDDDKGKGDDDKGKGDDDKGKGDDDKGKGDDDKGKGDDDKGKGDDDKGKGDDDKGKDDDDDKGKGDDDGGKPPTGMTRRGFWRIVQETSNHEGKQAGSWAMTIRNLAKAPLLKPTSVKDGGLGWLGLPMSVLAMPVKLAARAAHYVPFNHTEEKYNEMYENVRDLYENNPEEFRILIQGMREDVMRKNKINGLYLRAIQDVLREVVSDEITASDQNRARYQAAVTRDEHDMETMIQDVITRAGLNYADAKFLFSDRSELDVNEIQNLDTLEARIISNGNYTREQLAQIQQRFQELRIHRNQNDRANREAELATELYDVKILKDFERGAVNKEWGRMNIGITFPILKYFNRNNPDNREMIEQFANEEDLAIASRAQGHEQRALDHEREIERIRERSTHEVKFGPFVLSRGNAHHEKVTVIPNDRDDSRARQVMANVMIAAAAYNFFNSYRDTHNIIAEEQARLNQHMESHNATLDSVNANNAQVEQDYQDALSQIQQVSETGKPTQETYEAFDTVINTNMQGILPKYHDAYVTLSNQVSGGQWPFDHDHDMHAMIESINTSYLDVKQAADALAQQGDYEGAIQMLVDFSEKNIEPEMVNVMNYEMEVWKKAIESGSQYSSTYQSMLDVTSEAVRNNGNLNDLLDRVANSSINVPTVSSAMQSAQHIGEFSIQMPSTWMPSLVALASTIGNGVFGKLVNDRQIQESVRIDRDAEDRNERFFNTQRQQNNQEDEGR